MWFDFTVRTDRSLRVIINGEEYSVSPVLHPVLHALLTIVRIMIDRVREVPKAVMSRLKQAGIELCVMVLKLVIVSYVSYLLCIIYVNRIFSCHGLNIRDCVSKQCRPKSSAVVTGYECCDY